MCTSFLYRGKDTLVAMNYDHRALDFQLEPYHSEHFFVTFRCWGRKRIVVGVTKKGIFANTQIVNPCDAGQFKVNPKAIHISKLIENILRGKVKIEELDEYFESKEIVNPPQRSLHALIVNVHDDSWIVEPGRGKIHYKKEKPFFVMSNCPICDNLETGKWDPIGTQRQIKVQKMLERADENFSVKDAFAILDAVKQDDNEEWKTRFSLVYSMNENKVYYCWERDFSTIEEYQLG